MIAVVCMECGSVLRDGSTRMVSHGLCAQCYLETLEPGDVVAVGRFEKTDSDLATPCAIWINDEPVMSGYWRV